MNFDAFFLRFIYLTRTGLLCWGNFNLNLHEQILIAIDETAYANAQYDVWCSIGNLELGGKD